MIPESTIQRLEEAARDEQRLYRKRTRLALAGILSGGILLVLASLYTISLEHRAEKAHQEVQTLGNQERELRLQIEGLKTAARKAVEEKTKADQDAKIAREKKIQAEADLKQTQSELASVEKLRKASVEASSEGPTSPAKLTDAEKKDIESLVEGLYALTPSARGKAYNQLMKKFRYQPFVIEAVINRGKKELDKPRAERDVDGLYNSLVTLTDLSRQIIQKQPYYGQITTFADEVANEMPILQKRRDILIKWLNTPP